MERFLRSVQLDGGLTCFDLILERVLAVIDELLQAARMFGQTQVQDLEQLLRMMEVEHGQHRIVRLFGEFDQQLHHSLEKLARLRLPVLRQRKQICGQWKAFIWPLQSQLNLKLSKST